MAFTFLCYFLRHRHPRNLEVHGMSKIYKSEKTVIKAAFKTLNNKI